MIIVAVFNKLILRLCINMPYSTKIAAPTESRMRILSSPLNINATTMSEEAASPINSIQPFIIWKSDYKTPVSALRSTKSVL